VTRVLLYEPSYRRIKSDLPGGLDIVLVDVDGGLRRTGEPVAAGQAAAQAGWISTDLLGGGPARPYFAALLQSPDLRWVQSASAGYDNPIFARLAGKGVRLTMSNAQAIAMSEYVLSAVLDHFQHGPERRRAQAAHRWTQPFYREVNGSSWMIVGFGSIGQAVARRARSFDAWIVGVRRTVGPHPLADAVVAPEAVLDHLGEADVVVLSVPLDVHTRGMAGEAFLAAMKPGSVLVNVGRGGLVDEQALLAALDRGVPDHAILDVFQTEPLPAESRFWDHPRVSLTAHASAYSLAVVERCDRLFLDNLRRYLAGEPLLHQADPRDVLAR
jgi:phosphoglycerate dehydrogenase-like enzyme